MAKKGGKQTFAPLMDAVARLITCNVFATLQVAVSAPHTLFLC